MSIHWISILTFAAVFMLVVSVASLIYEWFFRYRLAIRERLKELAGEQDETGDMVLFKDIRRIQDKELQRHQNWKERLNHLFEQAGIQWTLNTLIGWCFAAGAGAMSLGFLRGPWWALGAFPLGAVCPLVMLYTRRQFRRRAFCRQLPEAFEMMSRAVRAGQTVPAALQIIAEDFDPPISDEFKLCYEQQNLGINRETALRLLAERTGVMELQIFVVALLVQARFGGDLAELLDNLATMIRKRFKLADRVRALTGEGRMQATVLTILPIAALFGIALVAPEYIQTLFDRPWMLFGTLAVQMIGVLWIRQIVRVEV